MNKNNGNAVVKMTLLCNANCKNCTSRKRKYKESTCQYVSSELFKRYIDAAYDSGIRYVTLSGGEPTLSKNLFECIEYVAKKGMKSRLMTNGVLLDERFVSRLHESGLSHVCLSLYSVDYKDYTELRDNKQLHLRAMKAAEVLSKHRNDFMIMLQTLVCHVNYGGLGKLMDFALDNGFQYLWVSLLEDAINLPDLRMTSDDCDKLNNIIIPQLKARVDRIPQNLREHFLNSADRLVHLPEYTQGIYHDDDFEHCDLLGNLHILFPNGKVAFCSGYDYFSKAEEDFRDDLFTTIDYNEELQKIHKFCKYCPHGKHVSFKLNDTDSNPI